MRGPRMRYVRLTALLCVYGAAGVLAQGVLPQTINVPVVFYDFHADGSNPNFEPPNYEEVPQSERDNSPTPGLRTGMVLNTLSADRKPIYSGLNRRYNDRLDEWFRPSGAPNAVFHYNGVRGRWEWSNLVSYQGRPDEFVGQNYVASYNMANVVIYETLPFTLHDATTGTYQFYDPNFFPLDNRGFGTEPATYPAYNWTNTQNRNFSFSMELHHQFTYRRGLRFDFTGDDDVWAFINNRLCMDLGGIHGALDGSIDLDTIAGLVEGET